VKGGCGGMYSEVIYDLYPNPSTTRSIRSTTVLHAGQRHVKRSRETLKNILCGKSEGRGKYIKMEHEETEW
jgi:hypothetical protein